MPWLEKEREKVKNELEPKSGIDKNYDADK